MALLADQIVGTRAAQAHQRGWNVLWLDGHVEWVSDDGRKVITSIATSPPTHHVNNLRLAWWAIEANSGRPNTEYK
jgi:prepilin-type processing-associated H-X9-DG protein